MKFLVTGATGFIGSNFVCKVVSAGIPVVCYRRCGSIPRVPVISPLVEWVDGDISCLDFFLTTWIATSLCTFLLLSG